MARCYSQHASKDGNRVLDCGRTLETHEHHVAVDRRAQHPDDEVMFCSAQCQMLFHSTMTVPVVGA